MTQEKEDPGARGGATGAGNSSQDCGGPDVGKVTPSGFDPQASSERGRKPGEASDGYPAVAASGRWRVVRCQSDIQLIVQYRQAGSAKWPWRAVAYVGSEMALPGVLQRPSLGIPADHLDRLLAAWRAR